MTRVMLGLILLALAGPALAQDAKPPEGTKPARPGAARVTVTRSTDFLYTHMRAGVEVGGKRVADLGRGETYSGSVRPGPVVIATSSGAYGGQSIKFNAQPGKHYRFTISPRSESFGGRVAEGLAGPVFGPLVAQANRNTGGFFNITRAP